MSEAFMLNPDHIQKSVLGMAPGETRFIDYASLFAYNQRLYVPFDAATDKALSDKACVQLTKQDDDSFIADAEHCHGQGDIRRGTKPDLVGTRWHAAPVVEFVDHK